MRDQTRPDSWRLQRRRSEVKRKIVTFNNAFHGRTLGAQLAGGIPALKEWIHQPDPTFVQVPFPRWVLQYPNRIRRFPRVALKEEWSLLPEEIAGVMLETYQGATGSFAPVPFMEALRELVR